LEYAKYAKKTFSTVLMAACDHEYEFIIVGAYKSESDGGIFAKSSLGEVIDNDDLNLSANSAILPSFNQ